jgi:hypothetical protein
MTNVDSDDNDDTDEAAPDCGLESVDLDSFLIKPQPLALVLQELVHILALIPLKLDHVAEFVVFDDGSIASELLLDDLEDLLRIEFLGKALDSGQGLTTIALLDTDVYVVLGLLFDFSSILVGFGEGIEGLEIFDGHKLVVLRKTDFEFGFFDEG